MRTVTEYAIFKVMDGEWVVHSTVTESKTLAEMKLEAWGRGGLKIMRRTATYTEWEDMVV